MGEGATGLQAFINSMQTTITPEALWGIIGACAGLIGVSVLFKFGYGFVKNLVNRFVNPNSKKVMK